MKTSTLIVTFCIALASIDANAGESRKILLTQQQLMALQQSVNHSGNVQKKKTDKKTLAQTKQAISIDAQNPDSSKDDKKESPYERFQRIANMPVTKVEPKIITQEQLENHMQRLDALFKKASTITKQESKDD